MSDEDTVQTSGLEPDLFGAPATSCAMTFTGRLTHKPKVGVVPLGDNVFVPALVIELDDVGAGHHRLTAHVLYAADQRAEAEVQAARLHRGQRVTVRTHLTDVRLHLPAAALVPSPTKGDPTP